MLDSLTQRLTKVVKTIRGQARLTESNMQDMLREIRIALLEADVAIPVVKDLIARIKEKALGTEVQTSLTPGQALVGIVHDELTKVIGGEDPENVREINLATQPPAIILLAGLQGAGKTTTAGKLGKWLKEEKKKKVLTVSADLPLLISCKRFLSKPTSISSRAPLTKNRSTLPARPSNTQSFITTTYSSSIRPDVWRWTNR
jgi:signal recognition particle subunit SRP54